MEDAWKGLRCKPFFRYKLIIESCHVKGIVYGPAHEILVLIA